MSSERIDQDLLGNPEPDLRPLTNEEKSQVDVNPDVSAFLREDAWSPTKPSNTLQQAGIEGTTWFQSYHQKTKSDKMTQFKQKWIHFCVKKYVSFAVPYKLTRDRFTAQKIDTTIDYQDILYYAALHPHTIAGFAETRDKSDKVRHVYQYLEKYTLDNEPGIVWCRRIMVSKGMTIQTATTPEEKPITPEHKEVMPTAEEKKEIKESSDKAAEEVKEIKPKVDPPKRAAASAEQQAANQAQPDYNPQQSRESEDREAVYTGNYGSLTWGYTLSDGSTGFMGRSTSKSFGKMIGFIELNSSNTITVKKTEWTDVTKLAIQYNFYDTKSDPGKQKYVYRLKLNTGNDIVPRSAPENPTRGNGEVEEEVISYERIAEIYLGAQKFEDRITALGNTAGNAQASLNKSNIRQEQLDYYRTHGVAGVRKKVIGDPPNQKVAYSYVRANDAFGNPIEVREPTRTPTEEKQQIQSGQNVTRTYFLEKRIKTESPLEDIKPAEEYEEANNTTRSVDAVNFDDWKTNVPKEKGEILAYLDNRRRISENGIYEAVGTATGSIITKQDFEEQKQAEQLRFYNAICKRFGKPEAEEFPQAIKYFFFAHYPERPNTQALMKFSIRKEEFDEASQDQNTSLDVLTIARAIKASNQRAKKKFSYSIKQLSDIGLKVNKVLSNYHEIMNGPVYGDRGKKEREIGMKELHREATKVANFHHRVTDYLEEQKIEFSDDDQIEFALTDQFKLLHIIHKSKVYFNGFYRDTIDNEIGAAFDLQNEPFPRQLLSGKKIIDRTYNQTTFGYFYFAEEIIKQHTKIGKKDLMPWVKFLQLYTFPVPVIKPDQAKPNQKSDEDSPTDIEPIVPDKGIDTGQGVTNSLAPRSVTEGSLVAYEGDPQKEERESARSSRVKNLEIKAQDAVLNCDNLPELAKQIKTIEDIFDIVLDRVTLLELFGELANKTMQDLKKNFALLDLVEGFSPEGLNGFANRFDQFVDQELSCVMDFVGKSLVEELFNGARLEDLDINDLQDIINSDRVQQYFGINIPLIPIVGLMDFIRKIVREGLERALTQVLLAIVLEGLEAFLGCDDLPGSLPDDLAAKLPDLSKSLDYGSKKINDLLKEQGVDLEEISNKLNTTVENIEAFMEVVSATLNAAEIRSLLEGDPGPLLLAIIGELMERFGLDPEEGKNTFKQIGQSIPKSVLIDYVPEKYYVEYCDERDFINAAQISRDLLKDKGLSDADQKDQALNNIDAAAEKLKSLCDLSSLAEQGIARALEGMTVPKVLQDMQQSSENSIKETYNNSVQLTSHDFILGSSKQQGLFSTGDRDPCMTMVDGPNSLVLDQNYDSLNMTWRGVTQNEFPELPENLIVYGIGGLNMFIGEQNEAEFDKPNRIIVWKGAGYQSTIRDYIVNPRSAEDDERVLVNLSIPAIINGQTIQNYGTRNQERNNAYLNRDAQTEFLTNMRTGIHGFGIDRQQIVDSFEPVEAIVRPPTKNESLYKTVYDYGEGLEFLNASFKRLGGNPTKSDRQVYVESPLFNMESAYNTLYSKLEGNSSIINAGPNFEKRIKRTNMLFGISARIYPFFCSIWPIFSNARSPGTAIKRILFSSSDVENTDIIMRRMIINYLTRKVRFALEADRMNEVYDKVIQEDYSLEEVVSAIVDPLFSDEKSIAQESASIFNNPAIAGVIAENSVYYPVQALCAMATIYLDASTNINSLVGTDFRQIKNDADTILMKMVNISEGSFK